MARYPFLDGVPRFCSGGRDPTGLRGGAGRGGQGKVGEGRVASSVGCCLVFMPESELYFMLGRKGRDERESGGRGLVQGWRESEK